ncbi:hypothetical protein BCU90_20585 [Vibrio lentus]|nr:MULTISPECIES: aldo/keto reductase [Vibrio]MCW4438894.1 aldo/keto reductase [Vibrio splendidus]PMG44922.1 hypothetical protein BCU90_20585 [Vibrio lentus]
MNVGLGTAAFGTTIDERSAHQLIDKYMSLGGNHIDTANNYAFWITGSSGRESEEVIGTWIEKSPLARHEYILASKVGAFPISGSEFEGLSYDSILVAIDDSLNRLKTDYLDILYLHLPDTNTPIIETLSAVEQLIKSGKIKSYGISNYAMPELNNLSIALQEHPDFHKPLFAQYRHSILTPSSTRDFGVQVTFTPDVVSLLRTINPAITLVGYSSLLDGLYEKSSIPSDSPYFSASNANTLLDIRSESQKLGHSPSSLVLKKISEQGILPLTMSSNLTRLINNLSMMMN